MNNIITLGEFVEILKKTDFFKEHTDCEAIVTAFFLSITDALKTDDSVSIKGFGDFAVISRESGLVLFTPDRSMADIINEPFAFFEPIELADVITDEMLDKAAADTSAEAVVEPQPTETVETVKTDEIVEPMVDNPVIKETPVETHAEPEKSIIEETKQPQVEETPEIEEKSQEAEIPQVEEQPKVDDTPQVDSTPQIEENPDAESDDGENDVNEADDEAVEEEIAEYQPIRRGHSTFALVAYMLLGIAIGFVIGLFTAEYIFADDEEDADDSDQIELLEEAALVVEEVPAIETTEDQATESASQSAPETAAVEQPAPTPQPTNTVVTDTVRPNHYLTHMSRRFYGGATEFWVYIYLENQDKLGHPDRLRPNTVVVIPPAEKYGIDPNSQQSRDAAKKKVSEIYAKFK